MSGRTPGSVDRPEGVAGLELEVSPTTLRGHPGLAAYVSSVVVWTIQSTPTSARSFVVDTSSGEIRPDVVGQLAGALPKCRHTFWRESFAALLDYDNLGELGRITAPTMLILGDGEGLIGREMQEQLAGSSRMRSCLCIPGSDIPSGRRTDRASLRTWSPSSIGWAPPECLSGTPWDVGYPRTTAIRRFGTATYIAGEEALFFFFDRRRALNAGVSQDRRSQESRTRL